LNLVIYNISNLLHAQAERLFKISLKSQRKVYETLSNTANNQEKFMHIAQYILVQESKAKVHADKSECVVRMNILHMQASI
jgi:hypothetical protein